MLLKASSAVISHLTILGTGSTPVSRVHSTTLVGEGYPEATPSENG
jgi:hypothetical protein